MSTTHAPAPPRDPVAVVLDAIDELAAMAAGGGLVDHGLETLTRRCRSALEAEAVLVAVGGSGHPVVVHDADLVLDPTELRRQEILAVASLDDPVIDGHPGLPACDLRGGAVVVRPHLRRLVTEITPPGPDHATLTICRRTTFTGPEVEVAMAFAGLARLVIVESATGARPGPSPVGDDAIAHLFSVGIALHLVLRLADQRLHAVVERAIDQLDQAIVDLRQPTVPAGAPA